MTNILSNNLINQKNHIIYSLKNELHLNYKYYLDNKDTEFNAEDYYLKMFFFSIYRAIEDLIKLLVEERKLNSISKEFYILLCNKNIKAFFIDRDLFKIIINDLENYTSIISYKKILDCINNMELVKKYEINDIKPSKNNQDDPINIDNFLQIYKDCTNNRNKLMHSITSDINLTQNAIINSLIVYSFLFILLDELLKNTSITKL